MLKKESNTYNILFLQCRSRYGTRISEGIGLNISRVKKLSEMTLEESVEVTKNKIKKNKNYEYLKSIFL